MMSPFEDCELTVAIPDRGLRAGERGFIVEVVADGKAYFVEFCDETGATKEVIYVDAEQIRPVTIPEPARATK